MIFWPTKGGNNLPVVFEKQCLCWKLRKLLWQHWHGRSFKPDAVSPSAASVMNGRIDSPVAM